DEGSVWRGQEESNPLCTAWKAGDQPMTHTRDQDWRSAESTILMPRGTNRLATGARSHRVNAPKKLESGARLWRELHDGKVGWVRGSAPRPPASKAGTLLHELHPENGAHGETRTPVLPRP